MTIGEFLGWGRGMPPGNHGRDLDPAAVELVRYINARLKLFGASK